MTAPNPNHHHGDLMTRRSIFVGAAASVICAPAVVGAERLIARRVESPLGSLTRDEQKWLLTAFAHLNRIYENRGAGRPGNNALWVFDLLNIYLQFLAPWDAELLVCEVVSAKSVPKIAAVLTPEADAALRRLGFEEPHISPNYSQTVGIEDVDDLAYAARLGFRALKEVYRVTDFDSGTFMVKIPS